MYLANFFHFGTKAELLSKETLLSKKMANNTAAENGSEKLVIYYSCINGINLYLWFLSLRRKGIIVQR